MSDTFPSFLQKCPFFINARHYHLNYHHYHFHLYFILVSLKGRSHKREFCHVLHFSVISCKLSSLSFIFILDLWLWVVCPLLPQYMGFTWFNPSFGPIRASTAGLSPLPWDIKGEEGTQANVESQDLSHNNHCWLFSSLLKTQKS